MNLSDLEVLKKSRLVHLCLAITFFTSGVIVNFIQAILYFSLRPLDKMLYRKINWYLCYTMYSQLILLGDWWSNTRIIFYVDREEFDKYYGKEHAYCIMNHTYEVDWLIGWMIADRIHLLGNCKAYAKKVIQYMPVLGWAWKFSEFVFLERSFDKDKDIINRQIKELAEHPDPMWLLLFPEGTRFTPKKHEASVEFAEKNNLPQLKLHLLPRTRGFIASLPSMKGKVPAIYDIILSFKEDAPSKPTITNMLFGRSLEAHIYMKRIPLEHLPDSPPEQEKFLRDMFVGKDKLRDSFMQTGDFFATSGVPRLEPFEVAPRTHAMFNLAFWLIATLIPMLYYLVVLLFSGEIIYFSVAVGIILASLVSRNRASALNTGDFFATSGVPRLEPFEVAPRTHAMFNLAFWLIATLIPMLYYLVVLLFSGEIIYFSVAVGIILAFYILLNKMIGMSEINKGSSYGSTASPPKKNQ